MLELSLRRWQSIGGSSSAVAGINLLREQHVGELIAMFIAFNRMFLLLLTECFCVQTQLYEIQLHSL